MLFRSVNVELGEGVRATDIRLFNTFGQLVSITNVKSHITNIDVSQLPNGIYFIQVFNADKLITTGKLVRN